MIEPVAVALLALGALTAGGANLAAAPSPDEATYVIHHIERPIGKETDRLTKESGGLRLASTLESVDRGGRITLSSVLRLAPDLTPIRFEAKGKTYRFVNVDVEVDVADRAARIRNFGVASTQPAASPFFVSRGFAPLAARALLIRYWEGHHRPPEIRLLPDEGIARIRARGVDTVQAGGKPVRLRRYSVEGVVWGREAVWLDEQGRLAALLTRIHILPLEAVRDDLVEALPTLQARAIDDRMADLRDMAGVTKPVAQGSFALVGGRLVAGTGAPALQDATVVVRDGRIAAAGPRGEVRVPKGTRAIDAAGKTIVPGLWDMHGHLGQIEWAPAYLAAGVTTARDVGGEKHFLTAFRDALASDRAAGPRLLLAGLVDGGGPDGYGTTIATTPEEGRAVVDAYKAAGFDQMKLYSQLAPGVVRAVTARAHELGMTVTGHIPNALSFRDAIESGMDQFEHLWFRGEPDSTEIRDLMRFLAARGTVAGPTSAWGELLGRAPETKIESFEPGIRSAPAPLAASYRSVHNDVSVERAEAGRREELALLKALHDTGVRVVAGTDGAVPGFSLLRTIELFVEAGMTPAEALASATVVPATFLGLGRETGTVEAGKRADLLILDADPLKNISNIRRGRWVVAGGRMYDCAALWRAAGFIAPH